MCDLRVTHARDLESYYPVLLSSLPEGLELLSGADCTVKYIYVLFCFKVFYVHQELHNFQEFPKQPRQV